MFLCYFSVVSGDFQNLSNVNLAERPVSNDPMYPSRLPVQGQPQGGAYHMNTGPRAAGHKGYPMNYGMTSQGGQTGYWATHNQSAMPGPSRIATFSSHVTPNAVMDADNNPQIISSMNVHGRVGQYDPVGMMHKPHQQKIMMGGNPFQPLISGNNMETYNCLPNLGGSIMKQNSAVAAQASSQEQYGLIPYQFQHRSTGHSPSSASIEGHTQPRFQDTPPSPRYKSSSSNIPPGVNNASIYQMVPPNQATSINYNQRSSVSATSQETSIFPHLRPGTPATTIRKYSKHV